MLPQAQKDIRRALRGLDQQLLGEIEMAGRASLGLDNDELNGCDSFVRAVEKCGLCKLLGSETPNEMVSLTDFVTDLSTEEMRRHCLFMGLDKSGVYTCDGNDRGVMKRLMLDEMYMTGFESLLSTFPEAVLSRWCDSISVTPSDKPSNIKCIMAHVFKLDFDLPQNEIEIERKESQAEESPDSPQT